jgi:hypothetical protein
MRWIVVLTLVLLIAACRTAPPATTIPNIVTWDHSPQAVVFQAAIVGGESDFQAPNCTIYGDNRIVWVNELGPSQIQVLEDRLPNSTINAFAQYLAVNERIYTYEARLKAVQAQADINPVVETVEINVNDIPHKADSFGGWDGDWFPRVLGTCKQLSQTPVLVAPTSGWVSAQSVPFDMTPPITSWDAKATGLSLSSVTDGQPHWISGATAATLWNTLHSLPSNTIFEDGSDYFVVALQVPGITRDAPPAPAN